MWKDVAMKEFIMNIDKLSSATNLSFVLEMSDFENF